MNAPKNSAELEDKMNTYNEMKLEFSSYSENESFAHTVISAFIARMDPTLEKSWRDVKDCRFRGGDQRDHPWLREESAGRSPYTERSRGIRSIWRFLMRGGISDITKAMEPLYTSKPELDRSGMGFAFMEAFMDEASCGVRTGEGTVIKMKKLYIVQ